MERVCKSLELAGLKMEQKDCCCQDQSPQKHIYYSDIIRYQSQQTSQKHIDKQETEIVELNFITILNEFTWPWIADTNTVFNRNPKLYRLNSREAEETENSNLGHGNTFLSLVFFSPYTKVEQDCGSPEINTTPKIHLLKNDFRKKIKAVLKEAEK